MSQPGQTNYTYGQLRDLWTRAGGRADQADMAAAVAMAESGGRNVRSAPNSNGSYDVGPWQINTSHGPLASLDPLQNARAAVSLSGNGTNWRPWCSAWTGPCSGTYDPGGNTKVGSALRNFFASTNSPSPTGSVEPGAVGAGGVPAGSTPPGGDASGGLLSSLLGGLLPTALTGAFWAHTLDVIMNWATYIGMALLGITAMSLGLLMVFMGKDTMNVVSKVKKFVPV